MKVTIDPSRGGKIRSILSKTTSREYLFQDTRQGLSSRDYADHDISGMDECFPTIVPCRYPGEPWSGYSLEDHGLLWNREWKAELYGNQLLTAISLEEFEIDFRRTAELVDETSLLLNYVITNDADTEFEYLYAAHLLLDTDQHTSITYPAEMTQVYASVVLDNPVLKSNAWHPWPPPEKALLHTPLQPERNTLAKLFSQQLRQGCASVAHGDLDERLQIEFDTSALPYLAILLSLGFSVEGKNGRSVLFGLEPTSGIGDDLQMCRDTHTSRILAPHQEHRFWLKISLLPAKHMAHVNRPAKPGDASTSGTVS